MLWSNPQSKLVPSFKESERANKPGRILTGVPQPDYSGREAPSHNMGSVCFQSFLWFANFALWTLTGLWPDDMFFVVCRSNVRENMVAERCRAMCALLAWRPMNCLLGRSDHLRMHTPARVQSQFIINHVILSWQFEKVWVGSLLSTRKGLVQPTILLP